MPIEIEAEGLDVMIETLQMLKAIGATANGANLRNIQRVDIRPGQMGPAQSSGAKNSVILRGLADQGRDFVSPTDETINKIATAFAQTVQARMDAFARTRAAKKSGAKSFAEYQALAKIGYADSEKVTKTAEQIAAAALKEAMFAWMDDVSRRIDSQQTVDGVLTPLDPNYADWKQENFGFTTPIGKASGQLLDNLDSSGSGSRNVTITRDKVISVADQIEKATGKYIKSRIRSATSPIRKAGKLFSD